MSRKFLVVIVMFMLAVNIASCSSKLMTRENQLIPQVSQTNELPTTMPTSAIEPTENPKLSASDEALLQRNFSRTIELSMDGYYYENLLAINAEEIVLFVRKFNPDMTKLIRMNIVTGESALIWESDIESVYSSSLRLTEDQTLEWVTYDSVQMMNHTYSVVSDEVMLTQNNAIQSPDGQWSAMYDRSYNGIWSVNHSTGKKEQWTDCERDAQPLWLPDSSGFVFLHDTGEEIGDGAGPSYELAQYDMASESYSVLSFEKGFWGRIEWLEPGISIVADYGFDDGVAVKIVNLKTGLQHYIVETTDYSYLGNLVEEKSKQLFISEQGMFSFYNSDGVVTTQEAWPTDLDEYTHKVTTTDEIGNQWMPYYSGGAAGGLFAPWRFQFSPDGKQLSYLLGAIGESMHDIVQGTRIALADENGKQTKLITQDYLYIGEYKWAPNSDAIFVLFSLPSDRNQTYLGIIDL